MVDPWIFHSFSSDWPLVDYFCNHGAHTIRRLSNHEGSSLFRQLRTQNRSVAAASSHNSAELLCHSEGKQQTFNSTGDFIHHIISGRVYYGNRLFHNEK